METDSPLFKCTRLDYNKLDHYFENKQYVTISECPRLFYDALQEYVKEGLEASSITKFIRKKDNDCFTAPWIDDYYLLCKRRNILFHKLKRNPQNQFLKEDYKSCNNLVLSYKRRKKDLILRDTFCDTTCSVRDGLRLINSVVPNQSDQKKKVIYLENEMGNVDIPEVSNVFNQFFVSVGAGVAHNLTDASDCNPSPKYLASDSLFLSPVSYQEIERYIGGLKSIKSRTLDPIDSYLLKRYKSKFATYLTSFINLSFLTGIVPPQMKVAKVIPIYKKGARNDPSNYRPISVLPAVSKILEKAVKYRLLEFLDNTNYFSSLQYGCRKGRGTLSATADVVSRIQGSLDCSKVALG